MAWGLTASYFEAGADWLCHPTVLIFYRNHYAKKQETVRLALGIPCQYLSRPYLQCLEPSEEEEIAQPALYTSVYGRRP